MNFTQSSHGRMQGSGVTVEGITEPPQYASNDGDSYGLKAAGAWSVWLWQHHRELVTDWALRANLMFCK